MGVDQVGCVSDDETRFGCPGIEQSCSTFTRPPGPSFRTKALYHRRRAHTCGPNDVVTVQARSPATSTPSSSIGRDGRAKTDVHSQPDELTKPPSPTAMGSKVGKQPGPGFDENHPRATRYLRGEKSRGMTSTAQLLDGTRQFHPSGAAADNHE